MTVDPQVAFGETGSDDDHRRLVRTAAVILAAFAAVLVLGSVMLARTVTSEGRVRDHLRSANQLSALLRSVFITLQDAETGQRGYLLTRDRSYLRPYTAAVADYPGEIARLKTTAAEEGWDLSTVSALDGAARAKLAELAKTVDLAASGRTDDALEIVRSNVGRDEMERIRSLSADLTRVAARQVERRRRCVDQAWVGAEIAGGVLGLFFALALSGGGIVLRQTLRHRRELLGRFREAALRQAAILDSATEAIVTLNPSGTVETLNRAARELFGYDEAALQRRDMRVLLDLAIGVDGPFLDCLGLSPAGPRARTLSGYGRAADGRRFPVDVSLGLMDLESGPHVVAVVRDVAERHRAEAIKDQFISSVSHELRTPLTAISGALGLLKSGAVADLPAPARRFVDMAHANAERLGRLVNDILDLEKIQSGRAEFAREAFDLRAVFRRTAEELEGYAAQFQVRILTDEATPLPPALGDPDRIAQVAANLISNAAKFSPEGGTVKITFQARPGAVLAMVTDEGPGIPPEFQPRVFTRFAQADGSDARKGAGTGLGLAICREIVDRLGGRISFRTKPGLGTRFYVQLPLAEPAAVAPAAAPPAREERPRPPRILICEDDLEMSEFLSALAAAEGAAFEVVHSLGQAKIALAGGGFDAALFDLNLPDGDGLRFLSEFDAPPGSSSLPVVIVSSAERRHVGELAPGLALVEWVQKPLSPAKVRTALRAALSRNAPTARRPVILHVEDDPDMLALVARALSGAGEVVAADSLARAKHALATRPPDLVVLDVDLADGSGLSLLPFLRSQKSRAVPCIVFSAQDASAAAVEADLVLTKSRASIATLRSEAARLLRGAPAAREVA